VIAGGGQVGFHLAKALLESSHEVMLLESDRRRAQVIEAELGSVVLNAPADEGRYQIEAGCQRADAVIAVTGEDPANLIICQLAKWKCNVPRVIARVNDPKNEIVFKALGIDETISSTRVIMNVIEQELPSGGFLPLMPLTGSHLELIEAEEDAPLLPNELVGDGRERDDRQTHKPEQNPAYDTHPAPSLQEVRGSYDGRSRR